MSLRNEAGAVRKAGVMDGEGTHGVEKDAVVGTVPAGALEGLGLKPLSLVPVPESIQLERRLVVVDPVGSMDVVASPLEAQVALLVLGLFHPVAMMMSSGVAEAVTMMAGMVVEVATMMMAGMVVEAVVTMMLMITATSADSGLVASKTTESVATTK